MFLVFPVRITLMTCNVNKRTWRQQYIHPGCYAMLWYARRILDAALYELDPGFRHWDPVSSSGWLKEKKKDSVEEQEEKTPIRLVRAMCCWLQSLNHLSLKTRRKRSIPKSRKQCPRYISCVPTHSDPNFRRFRRNPPCASH